MIKSTVEKMADPIGFEIGNSDDVIQAALVNGLCRGLANSMDERSLSMQLCHIVEKLDNKSCSVILEMAEFIKLKKANN